MIDINNDNNVLGIFVNVRNLQVNYNGEFIELNTYLQKLSEFKKRIILNIIPIDNTSTDIISIQKENKNYVNRIKEIVSNYNDLNFWYASTSTRMLYFLEQFFKNNCCGYYLSDDLNYVDTCFYIFPKNKYNQEIITQQLVMGKYIYLLAKDSEELTFYINNIKDNLDIEDEKISLIMCNNMKEILQ